VEWEETESAGLAGSVQIKALKARSESWPGLPVCDGTTGLDCESGADFVSQQGMVTPCWQQARTCLAQDDGVCAIRNGVPISSKLQTMPSVVFTIKISHQRAHCAPHFLAFDHQFLASLALASAALMIFMYLSGSARNLGLHIGQQNLISWLMPLAAS